MDAAKHPTAKVLYIGAHADDIELGAGGTAARLVQAGWEIWFCVLTSESNPEVASQRRNEAIDAAQVIGVDPGRVFFAELPDSSLICNGDTVARLRQALEKRGLDPDIVFTHSEADSHNDHRAAHAVTLAAFRKKPILCYAVVNSLVSSKFLPKLFIDISSHYGQKLEALRQHKSQSKRINEAGVDQLSQSYFLRLGLARTEAFEIILQEGASDRIELVTSLNDCPFHNFWFPLIDNRKLIAVHAVPVYRKHKPWQWATDKDREGLSLLRRSFSDMWQGQNPIEDYSCGTPSVENFLGSSDILLSGGAVSNLITRSHFNHFKGIRYAIDFNMPDYTDIRIYDRLAMKEIHATYKDDEFGNRVPVKDIGIITVMRNPMDETKHLLGCMGIHSFGSLGCFKVLATPALIKKLLEIFPVPLKSYGYQILISYETLLDEVHIEEDTLHVIDR